MFCVMFVSSTRTLGAESVVRAKPLKLNEFNFSSCSKQNKFNGYIRANKSAQHLFVVL